MLCPEERVWTPGFNCQLHFYLQRSFRFLCQHCAHAAGQPTASPSSTRSAAVLCRGHQPPLPGASVAVTLCSTASLSSQGLRSFLEAGAHSLRLRVYGVHGCTCMWCVCVCVPPALSTPGGPTSWMKSAMSAGPVGSTRDGGGRTQLNGVSRRSSGRPRGALRAASSDGWRSWLMS